MEIKNSYILVAGFAQLPKGTPVFELQKTIGCVLVVDTETDSIIKATFTFLQDLTNEFISKLLKGKSLKKIEEVIQDIERKFIVPPQKAVIQALLMAKKNYEERKNF
ncbi:DUF3870 domain-containing protein [Bacillus aquiflavi]|uniref:DUF3870 domain-containing protein n=1 Tax=Bacillus aquiflavi TaxID=2672567 RepID=UPI001CAA221E|nr:DUF3870 domain-containing protein [Bacillus aquiflavi]UAC47467.1 DUF3870 domain-containing protein [Bacillus aquiflavi]